MKTLFLSPFQPQNAGGGRGVSRLRFPPGPHLRSSVSADTHAFARLPPGGLRKIVFCGEKAPGAWWAGPQALGARAPSPLETWPTGPWGLDPATLMRGGCRILAAASRRCSSAHEKPGLLHRLISCAQSLQPSLTFLLRRNNKVQGARS